MDNRNSVHKTGGQWRCKLCNIYLDYALDMFLHMCDHEAEGDIIHHSVFDRLEREIKYRPMKDLLDEY